MEEKFCQSCGMPLSAAADFGSNADQSKNEEFCSYCFQNGAFTKDVTMDEMILQCAEFVEEFNKDSGKNLTKEEAVAQMKLYFPKLKRWAKV